MGLFSLGTIVKVLIVALSVNALTFAPTTRAANSKTWTTETDWGDWTLSSLSKTANSGSLTLNTSWTAQDTSFAFNPPNPIALGKIWGLGSNDIWIATDIYGAANSYHYNGSAWSLVQGDSTPYTIFYGFWGADTNNIWAPGGGGVFYKYTGSGNFTTAAWPTSPSSNNFYGIWGADSTHIWSVGDTGKIAQYVPADPEDPFSSETWQLTTSPTTSNLLAIHGTSATDVWAVGDSGKIIHYNGSTWSNISSPTSSRLRAVWAISTSDVWAVGDTGTIIHYNGTSWSTVSSGVTVNLHSLWAASTNQVWASGTGGKVLAYNGSVWSSQTITSTTDSLKGIWGTSATNVYTVGGNGVGPDPLTARFYKNNISTTSGTGTVIYTPSAGTTQDWESATVDKTLNGQTATVQYTTNTDCSTGLTNDITTLSDSESICIKAAMSTSDVLTAPLINDITITYSNVAPPPPPPDDDDEPPVVPPIIADPTPTPSPTPSVIAITSSPSPSPIPTQTPTPRVVRQKSPTPTVAAASPEPSPVNICLIDPFQCRTPNPVVITSPSPSPKLTVITSSTQPPLFQLTLGVLATIAAGIAALALVLSLAVDAIAELPRLLLEQWLQFIALITGRRRQNSWGTVRDSFTGRPLANVIVQLRLHESTGTIRVADQTITDNKGRFGFLANNGIYSVFAARAGYIFPSQQIPQSYQGTPFALEQSKTIAMDLYVDRVNVRTNFAFILKSLTVFLERLRLPSLIAGTCLTIYTNITYPFSWFNLFLLAAYLALWIFEYLNLHKSRNTIQFTDETGKPLPFIIVRITSEESGRTAINKVTDRAGEIYLLQPAGRYTVIVPSPRNPQGNSLSINLPEGVVPRNIRIKVDY